MFACKAQTVRLDQKWNIGPQTNLNDKGIEVPKAPTSGKASWRRLSIYLSSQHLQEEKEGTDLHGRGRCDVVVAVHQNFRLNDGHKPRLLHGARVTCQPPRVLLHNKMFRGMGHATVVNEELPMSHGIAV